MSGFTDLLAKGVLNWTTGQLAMPVLPSVWLGLFTTAPTSDAATSNGSTEVSGGSYARVQVAGPLTALSAASSTITFTSVPAWIVAGMSVVDVTTPANISAGTTVVSTTATTVVCSASVASVGTNVCQFSSFLPASGSAPSSVVNTSAAITFPAATGSWGTVTSFGLFDAATTGNLLDWDYNGAFNWLPCSVSAASPGVITTKAHGYANADSFIFSTEYGGTAPTFSAGNYTGIQTVAGVATDTFAPTGINTSASGSGMVRKVTQQVVSSGVTVSFAAASLTITSA